MNKKNWALMIVCMVFSLTVNYAQKSHGGKGHGGTVEDKVNRRISKIDEVCKLNDSQKTDLKTLFTDMHKKKKDAYCKYEEGSEDLKNAYHAIMKDTKDAMKKILTVDQQNLLKAHRKEMKDKWKSKTGTAPVDEKK